jgi:hypothetical protein
VNIDPSKKENNDLDPQNPPDLLTEKIILSRVEIAGVISLSVLSSFALPLMFGVGDAPVGGDIIILVAWIGGMSFTWIFVLFLTRMMGWKKSFWIGALPGYFVALMLISGFLFDLRFIPVGMFDFDSVYGAR